MPTGLPDVSITILNGQTGSVQASPDHIYGLVLSGVAATGLTISTPKHVNSLAEIEALGIDATYDTTNTTDVYKQLKDFYTQAGTGTDLWFMIIPKTTIMATACDKTQDIVKKLLNAAGGDITLWGISRVPDGAYTATTTEGLDSDVFAAVLTADALNKEFSSVHKPCRCIIGGRAFTGTPGNLKNLKTMSNNTVSIMLGSIVSGGNPAVGFTLGTFANRPIQRKIARVKDGDVGVVAAYMSNGTTTETYEASWNSIHDKGYIFFRKFTRKSGYFFTDDPTCCPDSDDYASMARGLVVDKAHRVAYDTFVIEVQDDIEIDENGNLDAAVVKDYQQKILNALEANLVATGNASSARCEINAEQNVIATNTVAFEKVGVIPKGYSKYIDIPLGFYNPANE